MSVTGTPEFPAKAGISIADIAAGMYAYSGCWPRCYHRARTGEGQALEVSMLEALGEWMGFPLPLRPLRRRPPGPGRRRHATIAPYGPVPTGVR